MDNQKLLELITALGLGGVLTAAVTAWTTRKKTAADTDKTESEGEAIRAELEITMNKAALELVEGLRNEVGNLRSEVAELKNINTTLLLENRDLRAQVDLLTKHMGAYENEMSIQKPLK